MNDERYLRTIEELEQLGSKWWPKEVREEANKSSILKVLLDSQDEFISILKLTKVKTGFMYHYPDNQEPFAECISITNLFDLIDASEVPLNLFLKHLAILSDFGAEPLKRVNTNFMELYPDGMLVANVDAEFPLKYKFQKLPVKGSLSNQKMKIDTINNLKQGKFDTKLCQDLVMLIMFGAASVNPKARAVLYKCACSNIIGKKKAIDDFVRTNYIRVSKILAGKEATDLGNVAQSYVAEFIREKLGSNYNIVLDGHIPGITDNDGKTFITFDVVVDRKDDSSRFKKYVGIEVSFQETTNSVVERKGGEAQSRFDKITSSRNFVAYVIDGGGNFERKNAMSDLCNYSHCNVAYTPSELSLLVEFIKEKIG